jgi:hypothetical protein
LLFFIPKVYDVLITLFPLILHSFLFLFLIFRSSLAHDSRSDCSKTETELKTTTNTASVKSDEANDDDDDDNNNPNKNNRNRSHPVDGMSEDLDQINWEEIDALLGSREGNLFLQRLVPVASPSLLSRLAQEMYPRLSELWGNSSFSRTFQLLVPRLSLESLIPVADFADANINLLSSANAGSFMIQSLFRAMVNCYQVTEEGNKLDELEDKMRNFILSMMDRFEEMACLQSGNYIIGLVVREWPKKIVWPLVRRLLSRFESILFHQFGGFVFKEIGLNYPVELFACVVASHVSSQLEEGKPFGDFLLVRMLQKKHTWFILRKLIEAALTEEHFKILQNFSEQYPLEIGRLHFGNHFTLCLQEMRRRNEMIWNNSAIDKEEHPEETHQLPTAPPEVRASKQQFNEESCQLFLRELEETHEDEKEKIVKKIHPFFILLMKASYSKDLFVAVLNCISEELFTIILSTTIQGQIFSLITSQPEKLLLVIVKAIEFHVRNSSPKIMDFMEHLMKSISGKLDRLLSSPSSSPDAVASFLLSLLILLPAYSESLYSKLFTDICTFISTDSGLQFFCFLKPAFMVEREISKETKKLQDSFLSFLSEKGILWFCHEKNTHNVLEEFLSVPVYREEIIKMIQNELFTPYLKRLQWLFAVPIIQQQVLALVSSFSDGEIRSLITFSKKKFPETKEKEFCVGVTLSTVLQTISQEKAEEQTDATDHHSLDSEMIESACRFKEEFLSVLQEEQKKRNSPLTIHSLIGNLVSSCSDVKHCLVIEKAIVSDSTSPELKETLFNELFPAFPSLIFQQTGSYVIEKFLLVLSKEQSQMIFEMIKSDFFSFCRGCCSSIVLNKTISDVFSSEQLEQIINLIRTENRFLSLALDKNGCRCLICLVKAVDDRHSSRINPSVYKWLFDEMGRNIVELCSRETGCEFIRSFLNNNDQNQILGDSSQSVVLKKIISAFPSIAEKSESGQQFLSSMVRDYNNRVPYFLVGTAIQGSNVLVEMLRSPFSFSLLTDILDYCNGTQLNILRRFIGDYRELVDEQRFGSDFMTVLREKVSKLTAGQGFVARGTFDDRPTTRGRSRSRSRSNGRREKSFDYYEGGSQKRRQRSSSRDRELYSNNDRIGCGRERDRERRRSSLIVVKEEEREETKSRRRGRRSHSRPSNN